MNSDTWSKAEVESMKTAHADELRRENTTLRARVEELEGEVSEEAGNKASIWLDCKAALRDLTAARKRIEELESGNEQRLKIQKMYSKHVLELESQLTAARKRIEELESELTGVKETALTRAREMEKYAGIIWGLEATCAAQREALEAYEKVEIEREKCRAGRAHINAALKWDRLRKKALSPTAGRDYRDAVLEEAAQHFNDLRGQWNHAEIVIEIRSLKRGGK